MDDYQNPESSTPENVEPIQSDNSPKNDLQQQEDCTTYAVPGPGQQ